MQFTLIFRRFFFFFLEITRYYFSSSASRLPEPRDSGRQGFKNASNLLYFGLQLQRTGSASRRGSGLLADELWTLLCLSSDVGFATVLLMTGFHPGITERLDRLRTYCTRRVRRDHPCNNAPSLPKNDRLTGGLGADVPLPRTSSVEDRPKGHSAHTSAWLGKHLSCWERGPERMQGSVERPAAGWRTWCLPQEVSFKAMGPRTSTGTSWAQD